MSVGSLNNLSSRAIIGKYYATLEGTALPPWVDAISTEIQSNQDSETYKFLGMTAPMREWVGGRQPKAFLANGISIINKHYELTLDIPVEDIRRDKTGQIQVRINESVQRYRSHWNGLLSTLVLAGTSGTCYDGHVFFDSNHEEGASGSQKNLLTSSEVAALNVATTTAPTADEAASALLGVIAYMHSLVDDQGEPMNEDAGKFVVLCGTPQIYAAMKQACTKNLLNVGTGVRDNPLIGTFQVDAVYNQRLAANTTQFIVVRTDAPVKPFIRQVETEGTMQAIAEGSELAFNNGIWRFGIDCWRNVGYGYWQYAAHATMN
jgi:phage major head subunit gpT-like protein